MDFGFSRQDYVYLIVFATLMSVLMGSWMGYVTHRQHMDGVRYDNARKVR
jgi:hypothetical protein